MKAQYIEITSGEGSTLRQTKKTQHEISFSIKTLCQFLHLNLCFNQT